MKRWLSWLDPNRGTELWCSIVDAFFDILTGTGETKFGRWFYNLESKDGQEPKTSGVQKPPH